MANHYAEEDHDPTVHHEERDINVRGVMLLTAIFVALMVVLFFGTWFLFKGFAKAERKKDIAELSEIKGAAHTEPPAPRLQPFPERADELNESTRRANEGIGADLSVVPTREPVRATPVADLQEMRREYDEKLLHYGWVDRSRGIVRMPIAEAKKRLLAKGLPVAPKSPVAAPATGMQGVVPNSPEASPVEPVPGAKPASSGRGVNPEHGSEGPIVQ